MNIGQRTVMLLTILGLGGCTGLMDTPKTIWGSSTRVLEEARTNAMTKTYDKGYWDCFRAAVKVVQKKKYVIFKKDEVRGYMVIMGIPGSVDTTEVGVFFVELSDKQTRIELSSLSTNAKRLLAKPLFHGMDIIFGLAPADKEDGFSDGEFQNGMTSENLLKTIESDGFSVPSGEDALASLNALLIDEQFYEHWTNKHKDIVLPKKALDLIEVKEKSVSQIRDLNRTLLEETYPTVCPKMKSDVPTDKMSVSQR